MSAIPELIERLRDPSRVVLDANNLAEDADGTPNELVVEQSPRLCIVGHMLDLGETLYGPAGQILRRALVDESTKVRTLTTALRVHGAAKCADLIEAAAAR